MSLSTWYRHVYARLAHRPERNGGTVVVLPYTPGRVGLRSSLHRERFVRSWAWVLQLGNGAGHRWLDLPGSSSNAANTLRCRWLSLPGLTLIVGRNLKRHESGRVERFRFHVGLYRSVRYPFTDQGAPRRATPLKSEVHP